MISPFGKTFDFDLVCPHCGRLNDAMTAVDLESGARPDPGSAIICAYCGEVSIVTEENRLREATPKESAEIKIQLVKTFLPKII